MQPQQPPNVDPSGAPVSSQMMPSSSMPTTSRQPDPTAIAAFREAQSLRDRVTHMGNQLGTVTNLLQNVVSAQNQSNDEQFYGQLGQQLTDGSIDQATYTRRVAERTAQRVAAQAITPPPVRPQAPPPAPAPPPQADPQAVARQAQQIGARAIVQGLGLRGDEPGLDFSSPQALMQSGHAVLAQRQAQQQQQQGLDVNNALGELGRQQGYVVPHRDGGRPAGQHPQATEADLDRIVWDKRNAHSPQRTKAALQTVRDSLAGKVPRGGNEPGDRL